MQNKEEAKVIKEESLGIESVGYEFIKLEYGYDNFENHLYEYDGINDFLCEAMNSKCIPEFQNRDKKIQFINWGDTELVYVLTVGDKRYTMLVGQPTIKFGEVKKEYDNLRRLYKISPEHIVAPMYYLKNHDSTREMYVTPYLYQARCISSNEGNWGVFIPEPEYHFTSFSKEERQVINSSMIALLVRMYDMKNNLGIASCNISRGGDFILEKAIGDFDTNKKTEKPVTHEDILKRMKLIAAREFVKMELEEYIDIIRKEFIKETYHSQEDESMIINRRSCLKMEKDEIEIGIELGMELRKKDEIENLRE